MEANTVKRIAQLEEELEVWEDKLHSFNMDYARSADPDVKFSIKRKIKDEVYPKIRQLNQYFGQFTE